MVEIAAQFLDTKPQYSVLSKFMMWMGGLFIPAARASVEMMYEFTEPFVVDSSKFEQTFRVKATPIEEGIQETAAWYKKHPER